jgi:hypothetical protein
VLRRIRAIAVAAYIVGVQLRVDSGEPAEEMLAQPGAQMERSDAE